MFGLTRLEITLALILLVAGSYIGVDWVAGHRATKACEAKTTIAADKQSAKVEGQEAAAIPEVKREAETFHEAIAKPVTDAPVLLCAPAKPSHPGKVLSATTPGPVPDGAPSGGEAPTRDIGTSVVTVGRDSDAQVVGLQDYIRNVCLGH